MYQIQKEQFTSSGHVKRSAMAELSPFDQVLAYMKNWDRSHGYKHSVGDGAVRSRLMCSFIRLELGISEAPKLEIQSIMVFEHFQRFKKWLNNHAKNGTLGDVC